MFAFALHYIKSGMELISPKKHFQYNTKGTEVVFRRCSIKKVSLEISQNSQENTCARVYFLIKWQASGLQIY